MLVHRQRLAALHTLDGVIDLKVGEDVVDRVAVDFEI